MALVKVKQDVISDSVPLGNRNLVINGDMNIWQRATSVTNMAYNSDGFVSADRWATSIQNTTHRVDVTREEDAPAGQGFTYSLKLETTVASGGLTGTEQAYIDTRIEGRDLQRLNYGTSDAKGLTVSFWAKSDTTQTFAFFLYRSESTIRHATKLFTISSANTWEKFVLHFDGDTDIGVTNDTGTNRMYVRFVLDSGDSYTGSTLQQEWGNSDTDARYTGITGTWGDTVGDSFQVTGIQVEAGDVATEFDHKPHYQNLLDCYRYYQDTNGLTNWYTPQTRYSSYYYWTMQFQVPMCKSPTVTINGGSGDSMRIWSANTYGDFTFSTDITALTQANYKGVGIYIQPDPQLGGTSAPGSAGLFSINNGNASNAMFMSFHAEL